MNGRLGEYRLNRIKEVLALFPKESEASDEDI